MPDHALPDLEIRLTINGEHRRLDVAPWTTNAMEGSTE